MVLAMATKRKENEKRTKKKKKKEEKFEANSILSTQKENCDSGNGLNFEM